MVSPSMNDIKTIGQVRKCIAPFKSMFKRKNTPSYISNSIEELVDIRAASNASNESSESKSKSTEELDLIEFGELNVARSHILDDGPGDYVTTIVDKMSNEVFERESRDELEEMSDEHIISCVETESMESALSLDLIEKIDRPLSSIDLHSSLCGNEGMTQESVEEALIPSSVGSFSESASSLVLSRRAVASRSPLLRCLGLPVHLFFWKIYLYASNVALRRVRETMRKESPLIEVKDVARSYNLANNLFKGTKTTMKPLPNMNGEIKHAETTEREAHECNNSSMAITPMSSISSQQRRDNFNTETVSFIIKNLIQLSNDIKRQSRQIQLLKRQLLHKSCVRIAGSL
ncbi:hypothetical protein X943_000020 [Babesia divergens]|uniref:Uncharacterized protein n=1 Tax=Babesia divergens TaxID=32595 RepID=A0AAD9LGE8_BABDI|nr:hypothetical protein X943_000020 [Babesia divergens]